MSNIQPMNFKNVATEIAKREGKSNEQNIAEISESLKIIRQIAREHQPESGDNNENPFLKFLVE